MLSRRNRFAAFPSLNDQSGDAPRTAFFSVLKNNARYFYFRKTTEQFCRCFAARRIHAHVERRVVLETEPARARIQLQRRNTEVSKNTVYLSDFRCREDPRKFTKVSMHPAKARAVLR